MTTKETQLASYSVVVVVFVVVLYLKALVCSYLLRFPKRVEPEKLLGS